MKVLSIKGNGVGVNPVAILTEDDLKNLDLLKKLKEIEAEYIEAGAKIGASGMFEIVEMENIDLYEANRVLGGKEALVRGLADFVKKFEAELEEYKKEKIEAEESYEESYVVEEYANQAALDNGYPD